MSEDAAALVARDWAAFLELLGRASRDTPTRLAGWSVEHLARHVHWGMTLEADALELVAAVRAGGHAGRRAAGETLDGPPEQIVPALHRARQRLLRACAAAPWGSEVAVPMPYGDVPLELAGQVFVMEAAMHRSDLAHAVGEDDRLEPGSHGPAAVVLQAFWPALAADAVTVPPAGASFLLRGTSVRVEAEYDGAGWGVPKGPHTVVISGDDDAVLLAGYGRLSVEAEGLRVDGDIALARRLKEFVPGP